MKAHADPDEAHPFHVLPFRRRGQPQVEDGLGLDEVECEVLARRFDVVAVLHHPLDERIPLRVDVVLEEVVVEVVAAVAAGAAGQLAVELDGIQADRGAVRIDEVDERELVGEDGGVGFEPVQGMTVGIRPRRSTARVRFPGAARDPEAVPASGIADGCLFGAAHQHEDEGGPQPPLHKE